MVLQIIKILHYHLSNISRQHQPSLPHSFTKPHKLHGFIHLLFKNNSFMENDTTIFKEVIGLINDISLISGFKFILNKQCRKLSGKLKVLISLFEELMDLKVRLCEDDLKSMISFKDNLEAAKDLLIIGSRGSKIFMVLHSEKLNSKFQELNLDFEQALDRFPYKNFDIPDEIKEQVNLVHSQFRRAKERNYDLDLIEFEGLFWIYNQNNDIECESALLHKLSQKLEFNSTDDIKEESEALCGMVSRDSEEGMVKISLLVEKFGDFLKNENSSTHSNGQDFSNLNPKSPVAPDDFRCPISLEVMKDPVVICTGQTYERGYIKKWFEAGHRTCPKTQETFDSSTLIPNYALSSLIRQWCKENGVEPPERSGISHLGKTSGCIVVAEQIDALFSKLKSSNVQDQRAASGDLRLLAKNNSENRIFIAEAGAIPLLVDLCFSTDALTQEHAVTTLLNLSICEVNKRKIISSEAVPGILHVLKNGSMEARENAAATIFSLSVLDEYKVTIGSLGAIPELVTLLKEGTHGGKKDAASALFNLCIYQGNKVRAIRAGLVPLLMKMLTEQHGEMLDEALAILALLSGHPDGGSAIGAIDEAISIFVKLVDNGSYRNKENSTTVLLHLCAADYSRLSEAQALGIMVPLLDLVENGSDRGKRKAAQLLELIGNNEDLHNVYDLLGHDLAEGQSQTQSFQTLNFASS